MAALATASAADLNILSLSLNFYRVMLLPLGTVLDLIIFQIIPLDVHQLGALRIQSSSVEEYTVEVLEKVLRLVASAGLGESSIIFEDFIYFVISFGSILANL